MNRRTRIKKDQLFPGADKQVLQVVGKDTMWASLSTAFPDGEDGQIIRRRNGLISWDSFPEASELQDSLDAKADKATTYTKEQVYTKEQTDTKATELAKAEINKLVDGAPAALDTLKEIADKISAGDSVVATLTGKLADLEAGKVDKSELKYLTKAKIVEGTEVVHSLVTAAGLKLAHEELSAPLKEKIEENKISIGQIRYISSETYDALETKANIDHVHLTATQDRNGFMSSADKIKLDNLQQGSGGGGISVYKVTVNEPNNAADKTAEFSGTVQENDIFDVLFVNGHNGAPATLKLGSNPKYSVRSNTGAQLNWTSGFLPSGSRALMIYSNNELRMLSPTHNHSISPMPWQEYSTRSENARSISGKLLWGAIAINKRLRHANPVRINGNCPAGSVMVGSLNGYVKAAPGATFSNFYPILWNEYAVTAGRFTGDSYVYADSVDLSITLPGYSSSVPIGQTYLVAKRNGASFVVEPEVFSHFIEEVDNNKVYFAIGLRSDSKTIYFAPSGVFWFKNGRIVPYGDSSTGSTQSDNSGLYSVAQAYIDDAIDKGDVWPEASPTDNRYDNISMNIAGVAPIAAICPSLSVDYTMAGDDENLMFEVVFFNLQNRVFHIKMGFDPFSKTLTIKYYNVTNSTDETLVRTDTVQSGKVYKSTGGGFNFTSTGFYAQIRDNADLGNNRSMFITMCSLIGLQGTSLPTEAWRRAKNNAVGLNQLKIRNKELVSNRNFEKELSHTYTIGNDGDINQASIQRVERMFFVSKQEVASFLSGGTIRVDLNGTYVGDAFLYFKDTHSLKTIREARVSGGSITFGPYEGGTATTPAQGGFVVFVGYEVK